MLLFTKLKFPACWKNEWYLRSMLDFPFWNIYFERFKPFDWRPHHCAAKAEAASGSNGWTGDAWSEQPWDQTVRDSQYLKSFRP